MKKILLLFILPLFLFGCNNFLNNETNVKVKANLYQLNSSRAISDVGTISNIEVWISEPGTNYKLVDDPSPLQYFDPEITDQPEIDLEAGVVRHFSSENSSISFDIKTNVTKTITLRVTYSSQRVFIGSVDRAINPFTTTIELDVYETATSKNIVYFTDLDTFLDGWE